jgi:hypothetical protein
MNSGFHVEEQDEDGEYIPISGVGYFCKEEEGWYIVFENRKIGTIGPFMTLEDAYESFKRYKTVLDSLEHFFSLPLLFSFL